MNLRILRLVLCAAACSMMVACAHLNCVKPLDVSATPDTTKAYIYGKFILDINSGDSRILLRFEEARIGNPVDFLLRAVGEPVYAVAVDPGVYRAKEFIYIWLKGPLWMALSNETRTFGMPAEADFLTNAVSMNAGKAYYAGDFLGECSLSKTTNNIITYTITHTARIGFHQNFETTTAELKRKYPAFANVECYPAFVSKKPSQ